MLDQSLQYYVYVQHDTSTGVGFACREERRVRVAIKKEREDDERVDFQFQQIIQRFAQTFQSEHIYIQLNPLHLSSQPATCYFSLSLSRLPPCLSLQPQQIKVTAFSPTPT